MNSLRLFNKKILGSFSSSSRLLSTEFGRNEERPKRERCLNKVTLLGRVGREGDLRGTSEHPCLVFPLATSLTYRKASTGEYIVKTDWHRIVVFREGLRNVASTIGKGDRLLIEGSLSHQRFKDENNKDTSITSVIAEDIVFLHRKSMENMGREDNDEDELERL